MKRKIFKLKLYELDGELICKSYGELIDNINLFIDLDLYDEMSIGRLQNIFNCCDMMFYNKQTEEYDYYETADIDIKKMKKKYNYNIKFFDCFTAPFIEYIITTDYIDYTDKLINKYYPQHSYKSKQTLYKYRDRVITSEIRKSYEILGLLDENKDKLIDVEVNSCITDDDTNYVNEWVESNC